MTQSESENIIEIRDLNFSYGGTPTLKNISLNIPRREIVSIIGPSGCGKTTLLRCLNRLHDLTPGGEARGEIIFQERDILAPDCNVTRLRRKIGMIFQTPNPFPKSIRENIWFGLKNNGFRNRDFLEEKMIEVLKQTGLWDEVKDRLDQSAMTLSGGQAQRLCIARSLAVSPEVILFDEPTSSLDPVSTQVIEELILELKESYSIVIVTHNMNQAARISDHTAFIYLGDLVEFSPTNKIFTNPERELSENYITGRFG